MAEDRARSFIERYVIARAAAFRVGHEEADAWEATQMGKNVYRSIANVAKTAEPPPIPEPPWPGTQGVANNATQQGVAGPVGPSVGTLAGVTLEGVSKQAWLAAGKECVAQALTACGMNASSTLIAAAKELFHGKK